MKKSKKAIIAIVTASILICGCGAESKTVSEKEITESVSVEEETTNNEDSQDVPADVQNEITPLRDAMNEKNGWFAGCAVTGDEVDDPKVWEIVTTHFNRLTMGNELKPDALVGYSCTYCPGTDKIVFNGEDFVVPVLDFSRAEKILNKVLEWNSSNPDREILVRGHVLLWHSQTPEWFFHEDYDKSKPYVNKEEMNKRLEWYIMTVLEHFTGIDSKYAGLFYGWDVVNEAISDGNGGVDGLRTDVENPSESLNEDRHGSNSSWYHIYQSNEFIINAFKYANKYAPETLELYYNDYNECSFNKRANIIKLLEAIKAQEGEPGEGTRISAMGMQGHYGMDNPSSNDIEATVKAYGKVVGKVQITEMDISASDEYKGLAEQKDEENEKLKKRYNMINFALNAGNNAKDTEFMGITFWGTVDHYSWLQSRSNVGGGNTTGLPQMPLLFDENYEPKPCFFVFSK